MSLKVGCIISPDNIKRWATTPMKKQQANKITEKFSKLKSSCTHILEQEGHQLKETETKILQEKSNKKISKSIKKKTY